MTATTLSAPNTKAGKLQRACLALLQEHEREGTIPTNGRFLFYELEQRGVVPKAYRDASGKERARTPAQDISDATMRLRELGPVRGAYRGAGSWTRAATLRRGAMPGVCTSTSPRARHERASTVGAGNCLR